MTARCFCLAVAALAASASPSRADPDPKRKVAVLEFRSGSSELAGIDDRLASTLKEATSLKVIDVQAARRIYGNHIDRDIVRCAGEARCIARIGKKLAAKEVLLVGISEFGDVILTLQRIDVGKRRVAARIAEALAAGEAPDADAVTRYLKRVMPTSDFIRFGTIRIDSKVSGAEVTVGGKSRGKTPVDPLRVRAPASYRISVAKSGFTTFRASVLVPPDAEVRVKTSLSRAGQVAWYKRWWVAAIAGTVVVGAATTAVLLTRDDPTDVPAKVPPFPSAGLSF